MITMMMILSHASMKTCLKVSVVIMLNILSIAT